MKQLMLKIYRFFDRHPVSLKVILTCCLVLLAFGAMRLHFVEDISSFLPHNKQNERINEAYQHIGVANKIMVNVSSTDELIITDAVEDFVGELKDSDTAKHIRHVLYEVNPQQIVSVMTFVAENMPYYLTEADYARIDSLLSDSMIVKQLEADKQMLASPTASFMQNVMQCDPLFFSGPVLQRLNAMKLDGGYESRDGYFFTKDGQEAVITITSKYPVSETASNALLIEEIQRAMDSTMAHFDHNVKLDCIGASVISVTNAQQIKKDSILSMTIAIVLILILLFVFFRDIRALITMLSAIAFGLLFGLAFMAIFKNSVSIIAIGIGSIIVGLAFNYPLHFLAHIAQGYSREQTIKDIVNPLITGNLTTVGAFLSLVFISSDAMKDLGLFSAMLLVGTILFVLIFLPHLFKNTLFKKTNSTSRPLTFGKIADFKLEQHSWIVLIAVVCTIPLYILSRHTSFETNMQAINYMTPDQRVKMDKLMKETGGGKPLVYFVSEGKTMEEALQYYEGEVSTLTDLQQQKLIEKQSGIGRLLPSQKAQQQAIDRWNRFWKDRREPFLRHFSQIAQREGFTPDAFVKFEQMLTLDYKPQNASFFEPIWTSMAENYVDSEAGKTYIYTILQTDKTKADTLMSRLNDRNAHVFAFDNSSMMSKMVNALSDDFNWVLWICGSIVFLFLTFSFGRIELSLSAFLPLAIGWIWILGLMELFGMKFNIVNIILATFIFGQGDDYTIFVTEGMIHEYTYRKKMLASYKNSVLLSASIMFIGIGSLIVAKHPAMKSLAEVTIVGMFSVVLMAYLIPPLIFRWLTTKKGKLRRIPVTLRMLLRTGLCFIAFSMAALVLTLIGVALPLCFSKNKRKAAFHSCLCAFLKWSAKLLPFVSYHIDNQAKESFKKPCVIIANHQSHLDLLYLLMLNPKIICLTNRWVWRNPFYGWIIRMADFYPIENGMDRNEKQLQKAVEQGYSVLIFPEGTRSVDNNINRFHQGAFYLAQKLQVDILPIILHGVGDVLPKTEFLLRKGHVDISIRPRISCADERFFGNRPDYETACLFRQYFETEYDRICKKTETPAYYHDLVYHNYIYKGRKVESEVGRLLRQYHDFDNEIAALPDTGIYRMENCGYGAKALLAALVKKDLHIVAVDTDADKIAVAKCCTSVPSNLKYESLCFSIDIDIEK